jgi:Ran GTPase-activating protein (RanGAP) involved in mRNA processing and transport
LYLDGNYLRDESLTSIGKGIEKSNSLKILNLSFNEIENQAIGENMPFSDFCLTVAASKTLEKLNLSGNFFNLQGYNLVLQALKSRKVLSDAKTHPILKIDVPERIENIIFDQIHQMNQPKGKGGKS